MTSKDPGGLPSEWHLSNQRQHWTRGDRVLVEAYLRQYPMLSQDTETLLDLIYNEVFLRECAGESPRLEEYLERFPTFAEQLRNQFEVHAELERDTTVSEPSSPNPTRSPKDLVELRQYRTALASLPDDQRKAVVLYYMMGKTIDELAEVMNTSPVAASEILRRAIKSLRSQLKREA